MSYHRKRKAVAWLLLAALLWWPSFPLTVLLPAPTAYAEPGAEAVVFEWRGQDAGGSWVIAFTTGSAELQAFEGIHLTAPQGLFTGREIAVTAGGSRQTVLSSSVRYTGGTLSFSSPHYKIGPSTRVEIEVRMAARPQPGTYPGSLFGVATDAEPTVVAPSAPVVVAKTQQTAVQDVSFQALPPQLGGTSEWVVRFRASADGRLSTGLETVTLSGPSGTRFSSEPADYTINGFPVARLTAASAHQVTLTVPAEAVPLSGLDYVILADGTANPEAAGTQEDYTVSTSLDTVPVSPQQPIAWQATVRELTLLAEPAHARAQSQWTVAFTAVGGLAEGEQIRLEGPVGMQFPQSVDAYTLEDLPVSAVDVDPTGRRVAIDVPASAEREDGQSPYPTVTLRVSGVLNPPAGAYGRDTLIVRTTAAPLPAALDDAPVFRNDPATRVAEVRLEPETTAAEAEGRWTVSFRTSQAGALRESLDTITLTLPEGSQFGARAADYRINGSAAASVDVADERKATVTVPVPIGDDMAVTVEAPVQRGPSAGYYAPDRFRIETSVDTVPASPAAGLAFGDTPLPTTLALSAASTTLTPGGRMELLLRALDASGAPLSGAQIEWSASGGDLRPRAGSTDSEGRLIADYTAPLAKGAVTVTATAVHGVGQTLTLQIADAPPPPWTPPPWIPPLEPEPPVDDGAAEPEPEQPEPESPEPGEEPAEPTTPLPTFIDLDGHWAERELMAAAALGIVQGYPDGSFQPSRQVSRAELAVMLYRAELSEPTTVELPGGIVSPAPELARLSDGDQVPGWAADAVAEALRSGLFVGYEDGSFRPDSPISRAELATVLHRVLLGREAPPPPSSPATFADIGTIPVWAIDAAQAARQYELMQGRGGQNFVPSAEATRAEAGVTLMRTALLLASASIGSMIQTR